ncbi:regulator of G-protein signaling 2 [Astyanax mexicanus]|uniref:Regulator of G-protein signaling 2 n=2 Tax=Astyanax mexicanus TaxID=7994 RepID=A0A8T2L9Z2_ASTMX|nr:regulator of G-protein signaling 2 [Astyanax mexicanus]KAG9266815.1 regulator of G-protein signaling 2 [Astyanax mexicanus]
MRDTLVEKDMACSACLRNSELASEQKGITRKNNWRSRLGNFLTKPERTQRKLHRPTPDDVNQWAESMEYLMNSKYGMIAFRLFMKSEYCEENIEFWLTCEEFRQIKSLAKRKARARAIYDKFIKSQSPKEINLDYLTKDAIFKSLHSSTQTIFTAAQNKVYSLMENNTYPRFLQSQLYAQLCQLAQGKCRECAYLE